MRATAEHWTWNMALAWILYQDDAVVDAFGSGDDHEDARGSVLLESGAQLPERLTKPLLELVDRADVTAASIPSGILDEHDLPNQSITQAYDHWDLAELALKKKLQSGNIACWGMPITLDGIGPRRRIETYELEGLDYRIDPMQSAHCALVYPEDHRVDSRASGSRILGFRQPRLSRSNLKKAIPTPGLREQAAAQARSATDFLARFLSGHDRLVTKKECRALLTAHGYKNLSPNRFNTKVWPEAIDRANRPDLVKQGRRRNPGKSGN